MSGKALADAVHIAVATTHKIKVVASFNFNYAAGVAVRARIENQNIEQDIEGQIPIKLPAC